VIGAGLAGLAAAIRLVRAGFEVTVSEASPQAGGRCRSYHDPQLGLTIDNGNHLVLSGNRAVMHYLRQIGAEDRLTGPDEARFHYLDLRDGRRWVLHPNKGRVPWWILSKRRRVPGTRARDYLALNRLSGARRTATIGDTIPTSGPLWDCLLENFLVAALNTPAERGSAALAGAIVRETLAKGGAACLPRIATPTLAAAFVEPAVAWLERQGVTFRLSRRLRGIEQGEAGATALRFADGIELLGEEDAVILAVPAWVAAELLPGTSTPTEHHPIVNVHFAHPAPAGAEPITGLLGGTAEWLFALPDRLSTTTSAADRLDGADRDQLAATVWSEVCRALDLDVPLPRWQIVRERRATFSATPEQDARRPAATTGLANLWLAGDWTRTGLPSTIEGAIRSGNTAADLAIKAAA
jgi:squalene-associated FAD-dependent desaturase